MKGSEVQGESKNNSSGFAIIKLLLIGIIIVIIIGTLIFVFIQRSSITSDLNNSDNGSKVSSGIVSDGTTSGITGLTNQDIVNEENSDLELDDAINQDINTTNNDANNLSGAYDVNNL